MKKPTDRKSATLQTISAICFLVPALLSGQTIMWVVDIGLWIIAAFAWIKYFRNNTDGLEPVTDSTEKR